MKKRSIISLIVVIAIILSTHHYGVMAATRPSYIIIKNLVYSVELTELDLRYMNLSNADLQPLAYMTDLKSLDLSCNWIDNLAPISGLTGLEELNISSTAISSLEAIRNLTKLKVLNVSNNNFSDLSPLSNMRDLKELDAHGIATSDISVLRNLNGLEIVELSFCFNLTNISALSGHSHLKELYVLHNSLTGGLNFIPLLRELEVVDLSNSPYINPEILELLSMLVPPNCIFLY